MTLSGTATIPALTARRAARQRGDRPAGGRDRARRPAAVADPDAGRVRQRDHRAVRARRIDQRRRPPARARAADRLRAAARAVRRALAAHAGDRRRASRRRPSGRQARRRRRRAGGAARARRADRPRARSPSADRPSARRAAGAPVPVVRTLADPVKPAGGLAVLRGSLAPRGAVLKVASADPVAAPPPRPRRRVRGRRRRRRAHRRSVARHRRGRRCSCSATSDRRARPGMPEWGMVPIPERLLAAGVRDMVRVSDARMSGTAFGTCVLHVAPESYAGGPLAAVRDGDVDRARCRRTARSSSRSTRPRSHAGSPNGPHPTPRYIRGYGRLHVDHVLQADEGCDLDFLTGPPEEGRAGALRIVRRMGRRVVDPSGTERP